MACWPLASDRRWRERDRWLWRYATHCFQKVTGGIYMSAWTRERLFAALKAAGVASILGWVLVLSAGPALAEPDPAPAPGDPGGVAPPAPGLPRAPLGGRTRHRSPAPRHSGRRGSSLPTARRWVWPSRSSSTSPGWSMTPAQPKAPSTALRSPRFPASSTG